MRRGQGFGRDMWLRFCVALQYADSPEANVLRRSLRSPATDLRLLLLS